MPAVKPKSVQVDLALSSLDVEVDVKDALGKAWVLRQLSMSLPLLEPL